MQRFSAQIAAAGIAVVFTLWSFLLVPYGDAYTQSHVAFYMAITVISCIFCLMYVRSAAFMVTAIVNGAFVIFLASQQPTFIAIAINVLLVCAGMMSILLTNYRNFERMIVSQQRTEALNNENLLLANIDSLTELPNRRAFSPIWKPRSRKQGWRERGWRWALSISMGSSRLTTFTAIPWATGCSSASANVSQIL